MHDDLVAREFTAERLNRVWLTDITEHPTGEGNSSARPTRSVQAHVEGVASVFDHAPPGSASPPTAGTSPELCLVHPMP